LPAKTIIVSVCCLDVAANGGALKLTGIIIEIYELLSWVRPLWGFMNFYFLFDHCGGLSTIRKVLVGGGEITFLLTVDVVAG